MAKAPSLQFYPGDVQRDTALCAVSLPAYGLWHRMLWVMFDGTPYGHLSVNGSVIPPVNLARLLRVTEQELRTLTDELEGAGVLSRTDEGVIYSRRMVRDAKRRETNALNGGKGGNPELTGKKPRLSKSVNRKDNPCVIPLTADANADAISLNSEKERAKVHPLAGEVDDESEVMEPKESATVYEPTVWPSFMDFWNTYDKRRKMPNAKLAWAKTTQAEREAIMAALPAYTAENPKQFRLDPERYLKYRAWEDEVIPRNTQTNGKPTSEQLSNELDRVIAQRYGLA